MNWFEGRKGEVGAVVAILIVVVLVGCSGPSRSAKMTGLRNHYGHVSLESSKKAGPAIGRGGAGGGAHGDWMSDETRGLLETKELAESGRLVPGPVVPLGEEEIVDLPQDISGVEDEGLGGIGMIDVPDEWTDPDHRPRGAEEDAALAALAELKTIFFEFDKSEIRDDQMEIVRENAKWLRDHPSVAVNLEGHCDERGTEEYNMALSEKRATAVRDAMISMGIQPHRLSAVGYGEAQPADPRHGEDAWSANRRVEFGPTSVQLLSMDVPE